MTKLIDNAAEVVFLDANTPKNANSSAQELAADWSSSQGNAALQQPSEQNIPPQAPQVNGAQQAVKAESAPQAAKTQQDRVKINTQTKKEAEKLFRAPGKVSAAAREAYVKAKEEALAAGMSEEDADNAAFRAVVENANQPNPAVQLSCNPTFHLAYMGPPRKTWT